MERAGISALFLTSFALAGVKGQWIFGPNIFLLIEKSKITLILILNFLKIEYCPFSRLILKGLKDLGICKLEFEKMMLVFKAEEKINIHYSSP